MNKSVVLAVGVLGGLLILAVVITLAIVLRSPGQVPPTVTPTITPTPLNDIVPLHILTTINDEKVCIGFTGDPSTLAFATCGTTEIQGSWLYNRTLQVLQNNRTFLNQSICLQNPNVIVNPVAHGQTTVQSFVACEGIGLQLESSETTITAQGGNVFLSLIQGALGWTTMESAALEFAISIP